MLNDPILEALKNLKLTDDTIKHIHVDVCEEEKKFKHTMERQALSSEDNMRCYNL